MKDPYSVLIVEDAFEELESIKKALSDDRFKITDAVNASEAKALLNKAHFFDIGIFDVKLEYDKNNTRLGFELGAEFQDRALFPIKYISNYYDTIKVDEIPPKEKFSEITTKKVLNNGPVFREGVIQTILNFRKRVTVKAISTKKIGIRFGKKNKKKNKKFVDAAEIVMIESNNRETSFKLIDGTSYDYNCYLGVIEEQLIDYPQFFKSHQSFIINLDHLNMQEPGYVFLGPKSQYKADLARRREAGLEERMTILDSLRGRS